MQIFHLRGDIADKGIFASDDVQCLMLFDSVLCIGVYFHTDGSNL